MRSVSRSSLVAYSASQIFALVEDIEAYPSFLPWCSGATIHTRDTKAIEASLQMRRSGISRSFRTRNLLRANEAMDIELVDGPFKKLAGSWRFERLGDHGCKVILQLEFEFESRMLDFVFGRFFEDTCNLMIDSFAKRANEIYA